MSEPLPGVDLRDAALAGGAGCSCPKTRREFHQTPIDFATELPDSESLVTPLRSGRPGAGLENRRLSDVTEGQRTACRKFRTAARRRAASGASTRDAARRQPPVTRKKARLIAPR